MFVWRSLTVWLVRRRRVSTRYALHVLKTNKFCLPIKSRREKCPLLALSPKLTVVANRFMINYQSSPLLVLFKKKNIKTKKQKTSNSKA